MNVEETDMQRQKMIEEIELTYDKLCHNLQKAAMHSRDPTPQSLSLTEQVLQLFRHEV